MNFTFKPRQGLIVPFRSVFWMCYCWLLLHLQISPYTAFEYYLYLQAPTSMLLVLYLSLLRHYLKRTSLLYARFIHNEVLFSYIVGLPVL